MVVRKHWKGTLEENARAHMVLHYEQNAEFARAMQVLDQSPVWAHLPRDLWSIIYSYWVRNGRYVRAARYVKISYFTHVFPKVAGGGPDQRNPFNIKSDGVLMRWLKKKRSPCWTATYWRDTPPPSPPPPLPPLPANHLPRPPLSLPLVRPPSPPLPPAPLPPLPSSSEQLAGRSHLGDLRYRIPEVRGKVTMSDHCCKFSAHGNLEQIIQLRDRWLGELTECVGRPLVTPFKLYHSRTEYLAYVAYEIDLTAFKQALDSMEIDPFPIFHPRWGMDPTRTEHIPPEELIGWEMWSDADCETEAYGGYVIDHNFCLYQNGTLKLYSGDSYCWSMADAIQWFETEYGDALLASFCYDRPAYARPDFVMQMRVLK